MERQATGGNTTPAQMVARLIGVLDAFLDADGDLGVTELSTQLGLSKSVIHRLVTALAGAGYLAHDPITRRYTLGRKALRMGQVAVGQLDIRRRALPYLHELAAQTGETSTLSLLKRDQRVYAEQVESAHPVRQAVEIGSIAQLYLGASGKAILAFLPPARRAAIVRQAAAIRPGEPSPIVDSRALTCELDKVRRRGFATSQNERVQGAASAAAPVFDYHGHVVGSISVAGVTLRHGPNELDEFGILASACAQRLSSELGWSGRPVETAAAASAS